MDKNILEIKIPIEENLEDSLNIDIFDKPSMLQILTSCGTTHDGTILITDPWFSKSGAFFGSWFQYPKNHHLQDKINEMINNYENSFIFISHEHQDHYDKSFLYGINKNTTILIPSYRDKTFKKDFKSLYNLSKALFLPDIFQAIY